MQEVQIENERRSFHSIITYSGTTLMLLLLLGFFILSYIFAGKSPDPIGIIEIIILNISVLGALLFYFFSVINRRVLSIEMDGKIFIMTLAFFTKPIPIDSIYKIELKRDITGPKLEISYELDTTRKKFILWKNKSKGYEKYKDLLTDNTGLAISDLTRPVR